MTKEMTNDKNKGSIQSVERALKILEVLSTRNEGMSTLEVGALLGINRTTTYSLLNTLENNRYVFKNAESKYWISSKLFELGSIFPRKVPLARTAQPYINTLFHQYHIGIKLAITSHPDSPVVILSKNEESDVAPQLGTTLSLSATATGKVALAFAPESIRQELIDSLTMVRYTNNTIMDKQELLRELARIRSLDYALDNEEALDNTTCIAFPIFNVHKHLIGVLGFSDTTSRIQPLMPELVKAGLQSSKSISREFGWSETE